MSPDRIAYGALDLLTEIARQTRPIPVEPSVLPCPVCASTHPHDAASHYPKEAA